MDGKAVETFEACKTLGNEARLWAGGPLISEESFIYIDSVVGTLGTYIHDTSLTVAIESA